MHTVEGTFRLKSGDIVFNPKTGEASGQLIVDATSGDSGNKKRDADMNKNVLESAKYPEIVFSPKHVTGFVPGQASSTVQLAGTFTIHGASHELTLTVPFTANNTSRRGTHQVFGSLRRMGHEKPQQHVSKGR